MNFLSCVMLVWIIGILAFIAANLRIPKHERCKDWPIFSALWPLTVGSALYFWLKHWWHKR